MGAVGGDRELSLSLGFKARYVLLVHHWLRRGRGAVRDVLFVGRSLS